MTLNLKMEKHSSVVMMRSDLCLSFEPGSDFTNEKQRINVQFPVLVIYVKPSLGLLLRHKIHRALICVHVVLKESFKSARITTPPTPI